MSTTTSLPRISVVVPSYNQGRFLGEALDSIFRQGYPDLEVVVMDGGSTDESVAVIRSFADRITYWQSQKDGGQSAAINAGVARCKGDVVAWLNSDDYYWGDALWTVGRAFATHPGFGLYIGNGFRYDQAAGSYTPFNRRHVALNREALLHGLDYLLQPSCFFSRDAWRAAGGLNEELRFCMDWDLLLRISDRHPAVLVNEFLAVSREYEGTKTSSGALQRAEEIGRMIRKHSRAETTPGSLYFLLETLLGVTADQGLDGVRQHLWAGMQALQGEFGRRFGSADSFPSENDPQDRVFLQLPRTSLPGFRRDLPGCEAKLPTVSIVTPSYNQAAYLGQTLDSILGQDYPRLESIVMDGGSADGSVDVLRSYAPRLSYWESKRDRGPAHAINKGFQRATGDIIAWVNSDDMLTPGAVREAVRLFQEDPTLDLVYGNALYINERNELVVADHGTYRTGLYYGAMQPTPQIPRYWNYVHAVPQPTVFFRRRLLEECGALDESYHFIFDFELFYRFGQKARTRKLERTQAFYRIHTRSKTSDWNRFLVELYRFSRPHWPTGWGREFRAYLRDFVGNYMRRRYGGRPRDWRFWVRAGLTALSAVTRVGNPEDFSPPARPLPEGGEPFLLTPVRTTQSEGCAIERRPSGLMHNSLFCSFRLPYFPGHSGGEIRDFHLIRHLLRVSDVRFFGIYESTPDGRADVLGSHLDALDVPAERLAPLSPADIASYQQRASTERGPNWVQSRDAGGGGIFHSDAAQRIPLIEKYRLAGLRAAVEDNPPDFLFVSPQLNPAALLLDTQNSRTRLVMASYDVESVRMQRLVAVARDRHERKEAQAEAERAHYFEETNLACYDGVIAVSDLDKQLFVSEYGLPPDRVLVVENSIDPDYIPFTPRHSGERQAILFLGSLGYSPNKQAALRLLNRIMPSVWRTRPKTNLWIVGQGADASLLAHHDGARVFVTGRVEDVRPYLASASLLCVPLLAGSGTKYKVLEAMAAGLPVVGSPLAAEGLDVLNGQEMLIGDSDSQLADAALRVLDDQGLAARLAVQGRSFVERRHTWDIALSGLADWLAELAARPKRSASQQTRPRLDQPAMKAA